MERDPTVRLLNIYVSQMLPLLADLIPFYVGIYHVGGVSFFSSKRKVTLIGHLWVLQPLSQSEQKPSLFVPGLRATALKKKKKKAILAPLTGNYAHGRNSTEVKGNTKI